MDSRSSGPLIKSKGSRRLALNACDACRQRKTKCDEAKPSCSRCVRLDLDCSYVETLASQKSLSLNALAETLHRIDTRLDDLTELVSHNQAHAACTSQQNNLNANISTPNQSQGRSPVTHSTATENGMLQNSSSLVFNTRGVSDELSLSQRHSTAPQYLLSWACSKLQLNELEIQYPLALESCKPKLNPSTDPPPLVDAGERGMQWVSRLSWSQMRHLVQAYFAHFHPSCLILDESNFYENILGVVLRRNFSNDIETCIVLLVFALGSIVARHTGYPEWAQLNDNNNGNADDGYGIDDTGLGFFNLATQLFLQVESTDWMSVQCLLLTGLFYSSKLRVFDAWRSINRACSSIIILVSLKASQEAQHCQLFWIAYLQESQLLAEFDFPPSGLGRFASSIPLPLVPNSETQPEYQLYQFFFLALISMRKILNRIMYHLYNQRFYDSWEHNVSTTPSLLLSPLDSLVAELDRQIEEWRACLPPGLEFPAYTPTNEPVSIHAMQIRSTQERLRGHLMVRYFAAKSILYRPFLHRVLHRDGTINVEDVEKARTAVDAALNSVLNSGLPQEPLTLLLHPINSLRSLFALEIEIALILSSGEACRAILPYNWELAQQIRARIHPESIKHSATASRDYELLQALV